MDDGKMRLLLAARLSRLSANGEQGLGIDTPDERATEWSAREGHEIIAVTADTKSGTVAPWDRPKLRPWVTDPEKMALYDGILAYRNDRLSRGCWDDEARIRMWAKDNGKHLVIVDGPQWPPRDDGDRWQWEAMSIQARKEWPSTARDAAPRCTGTAAWFITGATGSQSAAFGPAGTWLRWRLSTHSST